MPPYRHTPPRHSATPPGAEYPPCSHCHQPIKGMLVIGMGETALGRLLCSQCAQPRDAARRLARLVAQGGRDTPPT